MKKVYEKSAFKNNGFFMLFLSIMLMLSAILIPIAGPVLAVNTNIISHYSLTGPTLGNFSCPENKDSIATYPLKSTITYGNELDDNFQGIGNFTSCVYQMPDGSTKYTTREVFTGSIKRCGEGSLVLEIRGTTSAPDPVTGNMYSHGTWEVLSGSGTDDFSKIKEATGIEDSTTNSSYSVSGLFTGNISC